MIQWFILILALILSLKAFALEEEDEINKSIVEVQQQLKNPETRKGMVETDSAKAASQYVKEISGDSADEQAIYELASSIMGNFKGKKMSDIKLIIEEASKNPEAFANTFTPEQRKKLQEVAKRLPANKNTKLNP